VVAGAAAAAGQLLDASLLQQVGQVAGGGGLTDLGHLLVLRSIDSLFDTLLATVQQAVEYFDLLL
jgi:hypothetical protein